MKYIRTRENIFEVIEETDLVYRVKAKGNPNNIYSKSKCQTDVVKSGNTIEELCDEFVALLFDDETLYECSLGYYTEIFKARTHCIQSLIKNYDINMISVRDVYGAIWTDKGLIYVAKMNEKGELELL